MSIPEEITPAPDDLDVPGDVEVGQASEERDIDDDDVLVLEESELVLPVWEPTGEPRVDAALDLLSGLVPEDVHQHAAVFDEIHQQLRGTLTDLDPSV